jgi:hypothetical protein
MFILICGLLASVAGGAYINCSQNSDWHMGRNYAFFFNMNIAGYTLNLGRATCKQIDTEADLAVLYDPYNLNLAKAVAFNINNDGSCYPGWSIGLYKADGSLKPDRNWTWVDGSLYFDKKRVSMYEGTMTGWRNGLPSSNAIELAMFAMDFNGAGEYNLWDFLGARQCNGGVPGTFLICGVPGKSIR